MSLNLKRTAVAATGGALLALAPFLFWRTFLRQVPLTPPSTATIGDRFEPTPAVSAASEPDRQVRVRELLPNAATALTLDTASGKLRMYESDTGRAFEIDPSTLRVRTLSESRLEGFLDSVWSPNGHDVISSFGTGSGIRFRYYDYLSGRTAEFPAGTSRVAFSPDGSRVVSVRESAGEALLWLSLPDGSESRLLLSTRMKISALSWPQAESVSVVAEREEGHSGLILVDMNGKLSSLISDRRDLQVVWSRTGTSALVSYVQEGRHALYLWHSSTAVPVPLNIGARASKCSWYRDGTAVTCGIADQQSTVASRDSIVTVPLASGNAIVRYRPGAGIFLGVQNPVMLATGNGMAFVNIFGQKPNLVTW